MNNALLSQLILNLIILTNFGMFRMNHIAVPYFTSQPSAVILTWTLQPMLQIQKLGFLDLTLASIQNCYYYLYFHSLIHFNHLQFRQFKMVDPLIHSSRSNHERISEY